MNKIACQSAPNEETSTKYPGKRKFAVLAILASILMAVGNASALVINLSYDPDATFTAAGLTANDIVAMKAANTYAALQLTSRFTDNINVNILVTAIPGTGTLGMSSTPIRSVDSFAALRAAMVADSRTADDATALGGGGSIPATDPIPGAHVYFVTQAQAKALGLIPDNAVTSDGTFTFGGGHMYAYDPNNRAVAGRIDYVGLALHEFTEIMGRIGNMGDGMPDPQYQQMDLFHFTGAGTRGLNKGPGRSFSIDNGTTLLKAFNDFNANMGDLQDWASGTNDSFNAFSSDGVLNDLSDVDLQVMDVIGFDRGTTGPTPTPSGTALGNISTRLRVETGDNALIGGFIVTGTQPKRVIVRAIGPSLTMFPDRLADPTLELRDAAGALVASNDNWRSTQEAEIIATMVPPTNDLESAIVAILPANNAGYTAIVRGANNGTGIGVVEAYDLDRTVNSRLGNISTRGSVQTGNNVLIAGTIVLGQAAQRVIVRALGPSLTVPGSMADPTLELRDGNGVLLASNDNWRSTQEAEIIATGIPPTNDMESAIVTMLPANNAAYTAIVRGVNDTTGIAVVEVYAIQ